ncbi:MAG TPA: PPA1309 family protein [Marmoricola sp.]
MDQGSGVEDAAGVCIVTALQEVVGELERHAAAGGWDQPAALYALVSTADLIAREPGLADTLADATSLTPVQQDEVDAEHLEAFLQQIAWPPEVAGVAAVVERLVLPPEAEGEVPDDAAAAATYAAAHPERQEVRIVAAATRDGEAWCTLRFRAYDEDDKVLGATDLVPPLVDLLRATLDLDQTDGAPEESTDE